MDLAKFDTVTVAEEGMEMTVLHPGTGKPLDSGNGQPVTITLIGQDAPAFKERTHALANKRIQRGFKGGKIKITSEEIEADAIELLVLCTVGWKNIDYAGEKGLVCNPVNVRKLYNALPWLREQVEEFTSDRANFLKNLPKNSSTTPEKSSNSSSPPIPAE